MTDIDAIIERAAREAAELAARKVSEEHPRPTHVTIGQAAEMLHIGRWKATQLVKVGVLRLNPCGLIPIECVDAARSLRPHKPPKAA